MAELCEYATGEEKEYQFREIKGKSIRFLVKAAHDAHLAFTSAAEDTEPMVEVFLGGWEGAASAIRFNKGDDIAKEDTPDILSADEAREFWVAFDHDEFRVGRGGEWEPFLKAALPEPVNVTHVGFSTGWGATGVFQFFCEREFETPDELKYNYEPVYGDTVTFTVTCPHDAHLALTSAAEDTDPMYKIFLGGWENQNSAIRLHTADSDPRQNATKVATPDLMADGEPKDFIVSFREGNLKVGPVGGEPFMEWTDPAPWKVTHVGYCTGWGASGKWKMEV